MAVKSPNPAPPTPASKDAARQCLLLADKLLKELNFKACREQLQKAKELDPTNPYIYAFEDRISYFEQQEKKKAESKVAKPVVMQNVQEAIAKGQVRPHAAPSTPPPTSPPPQKEKKEIVQPDPDEQRRREQEVRALAEERKRKELEAKIADEVKKRLESEEQRKSVPLDSTEQMIRKEIEARVAAEKRKQDTDIWANTEARLIEERKRQEEEVRAAVEARLAEERIKKEMENRLIEERMRKEVEIRAAIEARLAEEKMKRDMEERILEGRRRQEAEIRATIELRLAEEQRKREAEAKASLETRLAEEKLRQEIEARALEEQRRKEAEASALEERKKAEEMRRQLEELTQALEREKKAREEIATRHLQNPVKQLRTSLEGAWVNGAPKDEVARSLHELAVSLSIPPEVEQSVVREVKLEMYSRAVKEVVSKRKLLRNSSSTLEWIRKVYQVSVTEYLENESRFLLDLVADQYNGTVLLVSKTIGTPDDLAPRLKSSGFAVVSSESPDSALEKIEKVNPNVILCDTEFPEGGLSGLRFLHVVRASAKFNFVPFIFLADAADVAQLKSSELKSNEGFVKKPIVWEDLTSCINEKLQHFREYISSLG